jgi:putative zinc finger/helix-turn-helix YgiT family protein
MSRMTTPKEIICFECGKGSLIPKMVDLPGYRHDEEFSVLAHGLECDACGFKTIDSEHSEEFTKLISDAYREKHGLLTGKQIREARSKLRMSQDEFARYLKVGPASVNRWENGQIQDEAMNELLLLKTDHSAATENYHVVSQNAATWSEAGCLVSSYEAMDAFAPSVATQYGKPKSTFAPGAFAVAEEVYAPLC